MTGFKFSELGQINTGRSAIKFAGTAGEDFLPWPQIRRTEFNRANRGVSGISSIPALQYEIGLDPDAGRFIDDYIDLIVADEDNIYFPAAMDSNPNTVRAHSQESGAELWQAEYDTNSIAVDENRVYAFGDDGVALNKSTGAELWSVTPGDNFSGAPLVRDGIVAVGEDEDGSFRQDNIKGFDAETGTELWNKDLAEQNSNLSGLTYGDGRVYYMVDEGNNNDLSAVALDLESGAEIWRTSLLYDGPGFFVRAIIPFVFDDELYVYEDDGTFGETILTTLNLSTGAKIRSTTLPILGEHLDGSPGPVVSGGTAFFYNAGFNRGIVSVNLETGVINYDTDIGGDADSLIVAPHTGSDEVIYINDPENQDLQAFTKGGPSELWSVNNDGLISGIVFPSNVIPGEDEVYFVYRDYKFAENVTDFTVAHTFLVKLVT